MFVFMIKGILSLIVGLVVFCIMLCVMEIVFLMVFFDILKINLLWICKSILVGKFLIVVGMCIMVW